MCLVSIWARGNEGKPRKPELWQLSSITSSSRRETSAYKLGETGQVDAAARVLKEYIGVEKSDRQRAIAQMILERRTTPDAT